MQNSEIEGVRKSAPGDSVGTVPSGPLRRDFMEKVGQCTWQSRNPMAYLT